MCNILFVFMSFFFWPFYCPSFFKLPLPIIPLVSLNFSQMRTTLYYYLVWGRIFFTQNTNHWLVHISGRTSGVVGLGLVGLWFRPLNNISVISWQSVLLVEESGIPGESNRPAASHWQTLSHNVVSSIPRHEQGSN